jgi:hypothetical protein
MQDLARQAKDIEALGVRWGLFGGRPDAHGSLPALRLPAVAPNIRTTVLGIVSSGGHAASVAHDRRRDRVPRRPAPGTIASAGS